MAINVKKLFKISFQIKFLKFINFEIKSFI